LSDVIVITSDNPRGEDPAQIIEEVRRGITADTRRADVQSQRVLTIVDRGQAIEQAIRLAQPGDLVLLAGKGHEKTQVIGNRALPFDDVVAAREALARRRASSGVV
jgi:UDP-N-acetylmuramoyl-L-alanyl-D-glutamate--2,6-diaminopimelate ligase